MRLKVYRTGPARDMPGRGTTGENGDRTAANLMSCSEGLSPFSQPQAGRSNGAPGSSHYDTFDLDAVSGSTVLSLLFDARDRYDDSLAFRYSCRGAVCGSCAMLINKVPRLACRTQVEPLLAGKGIVALKSYAAIEDGEQWNPTEEVLVEPLPHLPALKDLVVDMTKFFRFLQAVQPVLRPATGPKMGTVPDCGAPFVPTAAKPHAGDCPHFPEREYRMEPSAVRELEHYTNCILCGACCGACPVCGENPDYLGPAALAQLYRFHVDPREARDGSRLALGDRPDGWWACRFYAHCRDVCPKGVPPNLAIGRARQELKPRNPHPRPLPEGEGRGEGGRIVGSNAEGEADAEN